MELIQLSIKIFSILLLSLFLVSCTQEFNYNSCLEEDNCLLVKEGTNKTICNDYSYNNVVFVDNWFDSRGLLDGCEMPIMSEMSFAFKQHDQSFKIHNGTIVVKEHNFQIKSNIHHGWGRI